METLLMCLPRLLLARLQTTLWSTTGRACHSDLQRFPSPHGKNADTLALFLACTNAADAPVTLWSTIVPRMCTCRRDLKFLIAPMGALLTCPNRLFGSIFVLPGICTPANFPSPRWGNRSRTCLDSRLHNCKRSVNFRRCVLQRPSKVPISPM